MKLPVGAHLINPSTHHPRHSTRSQLQKFAPLNTFTEMRDDYIEWECFTRPDPDEEDPPLLEEIQILREFVEGYGASKAIPAHDAARRLMSLRNETRQGPVVDKGERVSWLLWDAGIDMPRYQAAILEMVKAIRALPKLERTEEQIRTHRFVDRLERWRRLEAFEIIWHRTWNRCWNHPHGYPGYHDVDYSNSYVSGSSFIAHHLAAYPPDPAHSSELSLAMMTIVFALEHQTWEDGPQSLPPQGSSRPRRPDHDQYITRLNAEVHSLVPLFEIAGQIIFSFVGKMDLPPFTFLKKTYPNSCLWDGGPQLSMRRWEFWKQRLRWISERDELMERTRHEAQIIEQLMQSIEQKSREQNSAEMAGS